MTLKQVIEALIFASPKPLTAGEIGAALRGAGEKTSEGPEWEFATVDAAQVAAALEELAEESRRAERGFMLLEQVNGWALATHPEAAPWVKRLYPEAKPTRLSGPALETLAIIAYRQPVTRAEMEAVRGVAVDGVMQVLLDRGLVRIAGRAEVPGRPLLYATTEFFLQHFGLKSTAELPNAAELKRIALPTPPAAETLAASAETAASVKAVPGAAADEGAPVVIEQTAAPEVSEPAEPAATEAEAEPEGSPPAEPDSEP